VIESNMMVPPDDELNAATDFERQSGRDQSQSFQAVFLLAPPRSYSSLACAMLGQHSQLYGLPETHLFCSETMAQWWEACSRASFNMADGLLRAVAQLLYSEQTEDAVRSASGWLRRRSHFTTGLLFEALADRVQPAVLVEKSPTLVTWPESMQRALAMFPQSRFIQVVQHPRGFGESLMHGIWSARKHGPVPHWMLHLASYPGPEASEDGVPHDVPGSDPQRAWYVLNTHICEFLKPLPEQQKMLVRGEDLLENPDEILRQIGGWLGIRMDSAELNEMKHPDRSPFASQGPPNAPYGGTDFSPDNQTLGTTQSLEGPVIWREDGQGFLREVKELARQFGYE
jgi:Sulfotransferase family